MSVEARARPPSSDAPAEQPRRVERLRARRRRAWATTAVALAVVLIAGTAAAVVIIRARHAPVAPAGPAVPGEAMAWAVRIGTTADVAVVVAPHAGALASVVLPSDTLVDVPGGGPATVGGGGTASGALLVAAVQAALGARVPHFVISSSTDLAALIDRLGGISVAVETAFTTGGTTVGPGTARLTGAQALDYLQTGSQLDRTAHWEEVLTGLFGSRAGASRWNGRLGSSDDPRETLDLLTRERGGSVLELPTSMELGVGSMVDAHPAAALVAGRLGGLAGPLLRVVVLNGNGLPGMALEVSSKLAPTGFRVVAAQNAVSFDVARTRIEASTGALLGAAQRVSALLGVGMVYVDSQPSGVADVTVVVGKDFPGA